MKKQNVVREMAQLAKAAKKLGPINFTPETRSALSELKQAGETFARMIEVSNRLTEAGLSAGAVLNLKPWEMPTVGTITEEHFAKLEAAIAAAKK